jgi:hypothetical protein
MRPEPHHMRLEPQHIRLEPKHIRPELVEGLVPSTPLAGSAHNLGQP